jgi:putative SOS response-associated peptidase YedK
MFHAMTVAATPFDFDTSGNGVRPIIRYKPDEPGKPEMINARWGSNPRFSDGVEFRFVRSEGKIFPTHRCLIPASEFQLRAGDRRHRVTLDDGNFFYLAGVWEPAMGDWPLSFRIITVPANPEVLQYQDRHGAIILRRQVKDWLDSIIPEIDLLTTPPARMFDVEEIGGVRRNAKPVQRRLIL